MTDDTDLYLDRKQLAARGWTRSLLDRFLPQPDRWDTVDHWLNYRGKATYFAERVMAAERLGDFRQAFAISVRRRRLTQEQLNAVMTERARVDSIYRAWLKTVTPEDVRTMMAIQAAADTFQSMRARGYRTPHK
jgi:hypothetical protein